VLPSSLFMRRHWAVHWFKKLCRARQAAQPGFQVLPDAVLSCVPLAQLGAGLGPMPAAHAAGGGDVLLSAAGLAPWRAELRERARELAFFHVDDVAQHAHAAYAALAQPGVEALARALTRRRAQLSRAARLDWRGAQGAQPHSPRARSVRHGLSASAPIPVLTHP
jgi:hypothetical protein